MPSVNMRRTTRVFGMVKAVDGARVLRSGRRLWAKSAEGNLKKGSEKVEWYSFVDSKGSGKQIGWAKEVNSKQEDDSPFLGDVEYEMEPDPDTMVLPAKGGNNDPDKLFGVVYSRRRQRKRKAAGLSELDEKKYGIHFTRRMKSVKDSNSDSIKAETCTDYGGLAFVVKSASVSKDTELSGFLLSILSYMRRTSLEMSDLYAFLTENSIRGVYLSRGVHILWNPASAFGSGICKLFGTRDDKPMFLVNFSTVPHCFWSFHFDVTFKHRYMRTALVYNLIVEQTASDDAEHVGSSSLSLLPDAIPDLENPNSWLPLRIMKSNVRPAQSRFGLISRGILKRRRSFRRSRTKNSSFGVNKNNGALASDLVSAKRNGFPFSSVVACRKVRRSSCRKPAQYINGISTVTTASTAVLLPQDMDSISCSVNLLVIESDKCFREEGATVLLEASASGEWCLAVKKDGLARYLYKASEPMKFSVQNRFTHATVWTGDNGWRLEFLDRDEWLKFKDLYRECFDRNRQASTPTSPASAAPVKVIPVPGVWEVRDYEDASLNTFSRPVAYISMIGDEVSRAMVRRTASYDMDCEDEEWLQRFNSERQPTYDGIRGDLEETFELMIDAFEKSFYNNPYDLSNDRLEANLFVNFEREVVEAVYSYWVKKRKHKRAALIRVLQLNPPRKAPVVPKPSLRKKRSFKRQASRHGQGKQPGLLHALAAERRSLQGQKSLQQLEEAKASASRLLELAISKRRRAQFLMGNANLAAYRATMALRIAEAAVAVESLDKAAEHFLHQQPDFEAMASEGDL